jgi:hypothetical protein
VTALWAGMAKAKKETTSKLARNTVGNLRESVNLCKSVDNFTYRT